MIRVSNDYWNDLIDQQIGSKPLDKVEIELTTNVWTDITVQYLGGATYDQQKELAPDKISAGDTRYSFDNSSDTFTPTIATSIFYGVVYIGKKIRFSEGFENVGYYTESIMYIKDIKLDMDERICYLFCQEGLQRIIDEELNEPNTSLIPSYVGTGNGTISSISILPFAVVSETWTIACTLGGADGVATFSATGSVTGLSGTTWISGTENSDTTHGIKFTIKAGAIVWVIADTFTFTTRQFPEWTTTNPGKIIWSILTGYGYDSGTIDTWSTAVFSFDHTKSDDNVDINYKSFTEAISAIDNDLTGYIPFNKNASETIEEIIVHFLGSIYTDNKGRISLSAYQPSFGESLLYREFADTKKIFSLNMEGDSSKIINRVTVNCKRSVSWAWSEVEETLDDKYVNQNTNSITTFGLRNPFTYDDKTWYSVNHAAQQWFADRIIDKFGGLPELPLSIEFDTGLDGMKMNLANRIFVTDLGANLSKKLFEVIGIKKDFESNPKNINIVGSYINTSGIGWCFLGSSIDEGDGISPQTADYDSATLSDKNFCYLSTTGSTTQPLYYLW